MVALVINKRIGGLTELPGEARTKPDRNKLTESNTNLLKIIVLLLRIVIIWKELMNLEKRLWVSHRGLTT
jgi:hypothetical protein